MTTMLENAERWKQYYHDRNILEKNREKFFDLRLKTNNILNCDSYKLSHAKLYPNGTTGMHSYIESRNPEETVVPFGLQMWIQKYLLTPVLYRDIDEAEKFAAAHGEPFDRAPWEYLIEKYSGYLPVTIYGVPEGTPTPGSTPLVTVECTDPVLFWLSSYLETSLQCGVWYPTTIASNDRKNYLLLKKYYDRFSDKPEMLQYALHDFGQRGVSSGETAEIGGAAHLVYFAGSDTVNGVRAANHYYHTAMSAHSVAATEHSIQCSYGPENQLEYLHRVLDTYAKPGAILSIVIDGYDVFREARLLCTELKNKIIESGAKIVFRPDSGDPGDIIPRLLLMQETAFGAEKNSHGMKVMNHVGIIQGDGVDLESMNEILRSTTNLGYAPENVVFGSGGALLQKVNRDTYKFAQKTSAILRDGVWQDVYKDPVTDPGKRSKAGRMTTKNMVKYYENGTLLIYDTLEVIRARAKAD